jgi:hypothetical protein
MEIYLIDGASNARRCSLALKKRRIRMHAATSTNALICCLKRDASPTAKEASIVEGGKEDDISDGREGPGFGHL